MQSIEASAHHLSEPRIDPGNMSDLAEGNHARMTESPFLSLPLASFAFPFSLADDDEYQDTINALFHNDPQTGGLSVQGYHDPNSLFWMGLHDANGS